jgi:hypothetical protein
LTHGEGRRPFNEDRWYYRLDEAFKARTVFDHVWVVDHRKNEGAYCKTYIPGRVAFFVRTVANEHWQSLWNFYEVVLPDYPSRFYLDIELAG